MTGSGGAPWVLLACLTFLNRTKPVPSSGTEGIQGQALPEHCFSALCRMRRSCRTL